MFNARLGNDDADESSQDRGTSVPASRHPLAVTAEADTSASPLGTTPSRPQHTDTESDRAAMDEAPSPGPNHVSQPASPTAAAATRRGVIGSKATPWAVTAVYSPHDWSVASRLGFPVPADPLVASSEAQWRANAEAGESKSEQHWHALCRGVPLLASASPEACARIRQGARKFIVPKHLRGVLWMTVTGLAVKTDENEYFCRALLHKFGYVVGPVGAAIDADLERTFPGHPYFSGSDVGLYKLRNVLHALCLRNPLIEYCQCFNFLAAFALLVVDDEERAFWLLLHVLEALLPNDYYNDSLTGVKVDQVVLDDYVRDKLPKLHALFTRLEYDVAALVPLWMMSLFVTTLPPETTLRVWDYILMECDPPDHLSSPAPMAITLALLKMAEPVLLTCTDPGAVTITLRQYTAAVFDSSRLLATARGLSVSAADLHQRRRHAKPAVLQDLRAKALERAEREERRLARDLHRTRTSSVTPTQETVDVADSPVPDRVESVARSIEMDVLS